MVDNFGVDLWGGPGLVVPHDPLDGHYQCSSLVFLLSLARHRVGEDRFLVVLLL